MQPWSRIPILLPTLALAMLAVACSSKPSEALIADFKKSQASGVEPPAIEVTLGSHLEANPFGGATESLHRQMELMAKKFGFRVEMATVKRGFIPPVKTYEIQAFNAPTLPGVAFKQEGEKVKIIPDFRVEIVVEESGDPATVAKPFFEKEALLLSLVGKGDEQSAKTLKNISAIDFAKNIERIRGDRGYKKAYLVRCRRILKTNIPSESPFWNLSELILSIDGLKGIGVNEAFRDNKAFWAEKGIMNNKDALRQNLWVIFTDQNGKIAQTEGWKTFVE